MQFINCLNRRSLQLFNINIRWSPKFHSPIYINTSLLFIIRFSVVCYVRNEHPNNKMLRDAKIFLFIKHKSFSIQNWKQFWFIRVFGTRKRKKKNNLERTRENIFINILQTIYDRTSLLIFCSHSSYYASLYKIKTKKL